MFTVHFTLDRGQVMMMYRLTRPWLLFDWIYQLTEAGKSEERQQKALLDFCLKKIKEKRECLKNNGFFFTDDEPTIRKISLLEYMVDLNVRFPRFIEQDIIEECCTFMLAGMESVSTSTALTLFLLAINPKWQERCVAELDEIFGDDKRLPTMQDLKDMNCLEMCIKESLRLYPSVPLFARTLGEDVRIGKIWRRIFGGSSAFRVDFAVPENIQVCEMSQRLESCDPL